MSLVPLVLGLYPLEAPIVGSSSLGEDLVLISIVVFVIVCVVHRQSSRLQAVVLAVHAISSLSLARLDVSLGPLCEFSNGSAG